jgi:FtsZ-binding cell division protein ZapB
VDVQFFFNIAAGALGTLILFILKTTWDSIKSLQLDVRNLMEELPSTYVRRNDFERATDRVLEQLRQYREEQRRWFVRIEDKLDKKADKSDANH